MTYVINIHFICGYSFRFSCYVILKSSRVMCKNYNGSIFPLQRTRHATKYTSDQLDASTRIEEPTNQSKPT